MNKIIPYTPFSMPLSGSARETELRLRNIFSGPKKRPPALFLALVFAVCILCGNLVSCQEAETKNPLPAEAWVDYWIIPLNVDWEESAELEPPEYPGVTFRWTSGSVSAVKDGETAELFRGMPIWNVFLCDLNGDGLRELCATVSYGSGLVDSHVVVYDYAAGVEYTLWDRGIEDYVLSLEDGQLRVTRAKYFGPAVSTGGLVLTENGTLEMTDEVPFPDGATLYHPYDPYGSEPDGNGQEVPETMENIPGVPLSEEELAQFNEIFYTVQANVNYFLPVNGFFNSYYDDVTELDFVEFLQYYPDDGCLEEEDAAEFEALSGLPDFPWQTTLTLQSDGQFEGYYEDADMDTHYVCQFHGRFGNIVQISDASFYMTLEELVLDTKRPLGGEWDEGGIHYISSEPYGFDGADGKALEPGAGFIFYLPEATGHAPGTELYGATDFLSWHPAPSRRFNSFQSASDTMGCYGLYNLSAGYGFFDLHAWGVA